MEQTNREPNKHGIKPVLRGRLKTGSQRAYRFVIVSDRRPALYSRRD